LIELLVFLAQREPGYPVMRAKAKRKERDELEEGRDCPLRVYVALRRSAHKRACVGSHRRGRCVNRCMPGWRI
jgi:hypothetical protein